MGATTTTATTDAEPFDGLLRSWERRLRYERKSERTIQSYLETANQFADWLPPERRADLTLVSTADVENWITELLATRSAATARLRYASLKQLFRWATAEGEVPTNPMLTLGPPAQPEREVPVITDDDLRRLLDSLEGTAFEDRRDAAVIWTLIATGIRAGELVGMTTADVDLDRATITVIGKGDRERTVSIGNNAVVALDRYLRARNRLAKAAGTDKFWIGPKGPLTDSGLRQMIRRRGEAVGITDLHPHRFRHTYAHRWLAKGGSEQGLQSSAGWRSPQMLARYGASAKAERAREEATRLGMDDL